MSKEANTVFIGKKPPMSYVLAVITSFNSGETKEVTLKARGRAITTAVDVVEIIRRRFLKNINISKITTGTEEIAVEEGGKRSVSTIEIVLNI
ncbi:MAG: DNA-binding protein Alba [Candidatus Bathyarchaeia archaeon]